MYLPKSNSKLLATTNASEINTTQPIFPRDYDNILTSKRKISTLSESCDTVDSASFSKKRVINSEQFLQSNLPPEKSFNNDHTHEPLNELNQLNQNYTENFETIDNHSNQFLHHVCGTLNQTIIIYVNHKTYTKLMFYRP